MRGPVANGGRRANSQRGDRIVMETRNKRNILTGGMILITIGSLIILHKMDVWEFSRSWPLLLIVIAVGTVIQRARDLGGWIIGCVGLVFFLAENIGMEIWKIVNFLLPLLLILVGVHIIIKYFRKKTEDNDNDG
jgi:putative Mn2+ efflux pump MntP